ncbi:MAG TPA: RagB/SusD family nutrient uptake outer membrane protein [Cyclobacteriaceae bacterium]|nr:RagB/SusD family nutrient uptake outer membrane protein [Cyclobacteriaceae bacterium]
MKLKSLIISFSVACAVLLLVGGCGKEFLDTPVQNAISSDILASSQDGVEASLISTYKMLNGFTNTVGDTWGSAPSNYIFNSAADDVHKGSEPSDNPDGYYEVSIYQWSPGFLVFTHKFQAVYEGVRRANNTIQLANRFGENGGDAAEVARIIAEAKFLRTWYHFEAYKMWKNVPYYDETDVDFTKPNTEDIIPKLVADLEAAIAGLPDDRSQIGRVDKTVAQALLGKVKLYAGDLTGAKTAFDIVVDSDKYKLAECYNDNFTVATENNTETVFAFQASVNDGDGNGTNSNFLERLAAPHTGSHSSCCGFNNPTQDLANAYRVDAEGLPVADWNAVRVTVDDAITVDPRLDWTMGRTGVPYLDWGLHSDGWIRGAGWAGMYSPKKNMKLITDPEGPGWTTGQLHAKNVQLIRYADVLLMLAECEVEVGSLERARELVNEVRTRAANCAQGPVGGPLSVPIDHASITWATYDVGTYDDVWTDKDAAREAVRRERRLELATEGHRIFDLRRWGILEETVEAYRAYESTVTNVVGGQTVRIADLDDAEDVQPRHYVFPLPSTEIDLSNGALQQNPGF